MDYSRFLQTSDIILLPFILGILFVIVDLIKSRFNDDVAFNSYVVPALVAKIIGAFAFCFVAIKITKSSDSFYYFDSANQFIALLFDDFEKFVLTINQDQSKSPVSAVTNDIGDPLFVGDQQSLNIILILMPIQLICFGSYPITTLVMLCFALSGTWKIFKIFEHHFPPVGKFFSIPLFFAPSIIFWTSGIGKDSFTMGILGWLVYACHNLITIKKKRVKNFTILIVCYIGLFFIKPHLVIVLSPAVIIWWLFEKLNTIENVIYKFVLVPALVPIAIAMMFVSFAVIGSNFKKYSTVDEILTAAMVNRRGFETAETDVRKSFYLTSTDFNTKTILNNAPKVLAAVIYRPTLLETWNISSVITAVENTFYGLVTLVGLLSVIFNLSALKWIFRTPFLIFSVLFSISYLIVLGFSVSNFGAIARLRSPAIPFLICAMMVLLFARKLEPLPKLAVQEDDLSQTGN